MKLKHKLPPCVRELEPFLQNTGFEAEERLMNTVEETKRGLVRGARYALNLNYPYPTAVVISGRSCRLRYFTQKDPLMSRWKHSSEPIPSNQKHQDRT